MSRLQDVRSRLEEYRKKKQESGSNIPDFVSSATTPTFQNVVPPQGKGGVQQTDENPQIQKNVMTKGAEGTDCINPKLYWLRFGLKVAVWLLLWAFFISVEFGLVFFVCSCLVLIILSMKGGKKRPKGTLSAYSVFNKNFEVIDGTLTAEQFERELRHGPSSVR